MPRFDFTVAAICFIIANIAYQAGLQFYDALLPDVSNESNRGRIGGIGIGVGYLGSFMAVALTFVLRDASGEVDLPLSVTVIALLFMVFAVPCFLFVRERGNPNPRPIGFGTIGESSRQTLRTLRSTQQYPGLVRFLIGRMFYTDAINTVIIVMFLYTIDVAVMTGRTEAQGSAAAQLVMLTAISFAVVGGFVWGALADRLGPKRTLELVLYLWMFVFTFAAAVGIIGLPIWTLYVVACSAGVGMGGIWAADRPYMLRLTPPARIGEFYGLYGMVGRFSAIMGPLIFGGIVWLALRILPDGDAAARSARASGLGVLMLLSFIIVSYVILRKVSDTKRVWTGADLGGGGAGRMT
jgi:UMF1 family MFS transporter